VLAMGGSKSSKPTTTARSGEPAAKHGGTHKAGTHATSGTGASGGATNENPTVGANENGANETGANETGANENGANATGANPAGANPAGANPAGANDNGANENGANATGDPASATTASGDTANAGDHANAKGSTGATAGTGGSTASAAATGDAAHPRVAAATTPKPKKAGALGGKKVVVEYDSQVHDTKPVANAAQEDQAAIAKARTSYAAGNTRLFAGDADGAIRNYKQALAYYPAYVAGYRGLGLAYAQKGDHAGAAKALRTYLAAAPNAKDAAIIKKRLSTLSK
jgi:tetratricopeptide (TPR) repeat protein